MSKKLLAMLLAAVLCGSALSGCGDDASTSSQDSSSSSTGSATTSGGSSEEEEIYVPTYPIVDEPVTFTAATSYENMGEKIFSQAYAEATNVNIDWIYWPDFQTQLGVAMAGQDIPDLIFNHNQSLDKVTTQKYGDQGVFVNYADYLQYMPNLTSLMEQYPESRAAVQNEDGTIYALPCYTETLTAFAGTIYYRTDMFEEAGVAEPTTTDELLQAVKDIQAYFGKDNDDFVAMQIYNNGHMSSMLLYFLFPSFGDEIEWEFGAVDGKTVTANMISDQYRRTLEYMHELYNSGGFDKNIYSEDGTNARAVVLGNNTAMTSYATVLTLDNFESGNFDVDMLSPLTSEYSSTQKYPKAYNSRFASQQISSKCEDVETLVKYIDALYAPEDNPVADGLFSIAMWFGIKGENWDYADDAHETYSIFLPEGFDGAETDFINKYGIGNAFNCIFPALNSTSPGLLCKGLGTRDKLLPYAVDVFPKNYLTFTQEESDLYAELYTDIQEYISQSQATFVTEGVTDDSWNAYVSQVEKMGIEEVLSIYQAAYDRYLAMLG